MSRETEKIFKEFNKFIADKNIESEDDLNAALEQFMHDYNADVMSTQELTEDTAETSDDFFELAESAPTKKKALKYAKKALELDGDNLEAEVMVAELSAATSEALLEKYRGIIDTATAKMTEQGYFDEESIGEFWLITETRPYMRLRDKYAELLIDCMQIRAAIKEHEEMLRLCENDNLGERYRLMHLYTYMEDESSALELLKRYEDEESTQFLLPLSILYYKLGNLKESAKYLKRLKNANKDTYAFFDSIINGKMEDYLSEMSSYSYQPFTIQEFIIEMQEDRFLLATMYSYYEWALKKLKSMK